MTRYFLIAQIFFASTFLLSFNSRDPTASNPKGVTYLVSVSSSGRRGNGNSYSPDISADGRFVAFISDASNLVSGDTNNLPDIFVHDYRTGLTERVNIANDGTQANGNSFEPTISGDGRYVGFHSYANNLVGDDSNGSSDVFVHDRQSGRTIRVSETSQGAPGNGSSPSISTNGRYIVFSSSEALVSDDKNLNPDIYLRDLQTGEIERVSVAGDPEPNPNPYNDPWNPIVSQDGQFVVFTASLWQLAGLVVRDRMLSENEPMQPQCPWDLNWDCSWLRAKSISDDGRYVAFFNEVGGYGVYVHDRITGETENIGVTLDGGWENGTSSFNSGSSDMRFVAFQSSSSSLVLNDTNDHTDIFVRDRLTRVTWLVSLSSDGAQGNDDSFGAEISASGRFVAFASKANNLVRGDTNGKQDIFLRDQRLGIFQNLAALYLPLVFK